MNYLSVICYSFIKDSMYSANLVSETKIVIIDFFVFFKIRFLFLQILLTKQVSDHSGHDLYFVL